MKDVVNSSPRGRSTQELAGASASRIKRNILIASVAVLALGGLALYASRPSTSTRVGLAVSSPQAPAGGGAPPPATAPPAQPSTEPPAAQRSSLKVPQGSNVLLITVDSLRRDYVGCYGGAWVPTPNIDSLATAGVKFEDAVTAVPITAPSHATLLTGWYPANHTVRDDGPYHLPDGIETLPEMLKANGYATAAFIGSALVQSRLGFGQGFDTFDEKLPLLTPQPFSTEPLPQRRAAESVAAALAWLDNHTQQNAGKPFFVWINFADLRFPCEPPEPFASMGLARPYTKAVAYLDAQIGTLLDGIRKRSLFEKTITVLVGAHGEGLGDHNEPYHGILLYEPTVAVPFLMVVPEYPKGAARSTKLLACTTDVAPTILGLLDITGARPTSGKNLFAGAGDTGRVVYIETLAPRLRHGWLPVFSFRSSRTKYIESKHSELYIPADDPSESLDLIQSGQAGRNDLRQGFADQRQQAFGDRADGNPSDKTITGDILEQLAARGHKLDPVPGDVERGEPRRMLRHYDQFRRAFDRLRKGDADDAAHQFRYLLTQSPFDATLLSGLAASLAGRGEYDEATDAALAAAAYQPRERHWLQLANVLIQQRDWRCADLAMEMMRRIDPTDGGNALLLGLYSAGRLRFDDAARGFEEARKLDPVRRTADSYAALGSLQAQLGKPDEAAEAYKQALEVDRNHAGALRGMAQLEKKRGRIDAQLDYLRRLMAAEPANPFAPTEIARACVDSGRDQEAVDVLQKFVSANPTSVTGLGNLANVYQDTGHFHEALVYYKKALDISPDYVFALYNMGTANLKLNDYDEAAKQFRRVLELQPRHPKAPARLLAALSSSGHVDEALETLERFAKEGQVNWDDLAKDEAVAALVGDPRFREVRAKYQAK